MRIQSHWCACMTWQDLNLTDERAILMANALVSSANNASGNGESECALLSLKEIQYAQVQKLGSSMEEYLLPNVARPSMKNNLKTKIILFLCQCFSHRFLIFVF